MLSAPILAAAVAGCAAAPFEYHPATEIPRGPGLFSGEGGALVLRVDGAGEREEFQRQKNVGERSPEYREFQEWREWREWKRRQGN
jgi:hypothetical protein